MPFLFGDRSKVSSIYENKTGHFKVQDGCWLAEFTTIFGVYGQVYLNKADSCGNTDNEEEILYAKNIFSKYSLSFGYAKKIYFRQHLTSVMHGNPGIET